MLSYPRINEISYRIEGYTGSDSNYRIVKAELIPEEDIEKWLVTIQRKEDDGKDFMQEIMRLMKGYKEKVYFRVLFAHLKGESKDMLTLVFVVEDLTEEKNEDERKE